MDDAYAPAIKLGSEADRASTPDERIRLYREAWACVPEPRFDWPLGPWIWNSLCTAYIEKKNYVAALEAARTAEKCHRGMDDSRTAYQIGAVLLDGFNDDAGATQYFKKASTLSGGRELRDAPTRYLKLISPAAARSRDTNDGPIRREFGADSASLSKSVSKRIDDQCEKGNKLLDAGKTGAAVKIFKSALQLLPLPRDKWEAFTWIYAAIGDAHFVERDWPEAIGALREALAGPGGIENPFIHLRLGQSAFECGQFDLAVDELLKAYMLEGEDIFVEEPKYLEFLRANVSL